VAVVTIALIAGADAGVAVRLGVGMLGLQFAIGSANDLADASDDMVAKPDKPIPAGLVSRGAVSAVGAAAAAIGFVAVATVSAGALLMGALGLADGLAYDVRLKRTPLAWMAFAAGVGLLPLYAWFGARGSVPPALVGVVALAVAAGAALALANAYVDLEADRRSGISSVATMFGPRKTLLTDAALLAAVQVVALVTTLVTAGATAALLLEVGGCGVAWFGLGLAATDDNRVRPLVWEIQAVGILALGAVWLSVLSSAGILNR
jgi:4-hydroxybenzoate polyprenyltransferase